MTDGGGAGRRPKTRQEKFTSVARRYDRINGLLSFGLDRRWRRAAATAGALPPAARVLDLGTGTGRQAAGFLARQPGRFVVGCDMNQAMLDVARRRVPGVGGLVRADAAKLPFSSGSFDRVTASFVLGDVERPDVALAEVARVLRRGGDLVALELALPARPVLRWAYRSLLRVVAWAGSLVAREPMGHLRDEILHYEGADHTAAQLSRAGFVPLGRRQLHGGLVVLHHVQLPAVPSGTPSRQTAEVVR